MGWIEEIKERRAGVADPPVAYTTDDLEEGEDLGHYTALVKSEFGPMGAWDTFDVGGLEWLIHAYDDQEMLLAEVERLRGNYRQALSIVDQVINNYSRVLPDRAREALIDARNRIGGLT